MGGNIGKMDKEKEAVKNPFLAHLDFELKNFAIVNVVLRQGIDRSCCCLSSPRVGIRLVQVHGNLECNGKAGLHRLLVPSMIHNSVVHAPSGIVVHFLRFLAGGFVLLLLLQACVVDGDRA
jgi:hypothetical protein